MITSTSNKQVKNLISLTKKAKERNKQGVFIVEGRKMFEEAPKEWCLVLYVSATFLQSAENQVLLQGYEYEILSDAVFRAVSDTQTPQGILCVVKMPQWRVEDIDLSKGAVLFLESIQDPGNLGTMLRTGEGAGIQAVIANKTTVDLFNPKTIRSTMGSIYRVPFIVSEDFQETILEFQRKGMRIYAAHLKGTMNYDEANYSGSCGFLIGNEGNGLSEEIAGLADTYIRIPMEGKVESLNAAIAATILMYEVSRQRRMS